MPTRDIGLSVRPRRFITASTSLPETAAAPFRQSVRERQVPSRWREQTGAAEFGPARKSQAWQPIRAPWMKNLENKQSHCSIAAYCFVIQEHLVVVRKVAEHVPVIVYCFSDHWPRARERSLVCAPHRGGRSNDIELRSVAAAGIDSTDADAGYWTICASSEVHHSQDRSARDSGCPFPTECAGAPSALTRREQLVPQSSG